MHRTLAIKQLSHPGSPDPRAHHIPLAHSGGGITCVQEGQPRSLAASQTLPPKAALFIASLPDTHPSEVSTLCQHPGAGYPAQRQHMQYPEARGCPEAGRPQEAWVSSLLPCPKETVL